MSCGLTKPDLNITPKMVTDGVQVGDGYEFVGGHLTNPRFVGHQPDIKIYARE